MIVDQGSEQAKRDRMEELVARAVHTGCPTAVCWAYYVAGLAVEHADVDRARTAYAKAVEHGSKADCRLLVMIALLRSLSGSHRRFA